MDKNTPLTILVQSKIYEFLQYHKIEEPVFDVREVGDLANEIIRVIKNEPTEHINSIEDNNKQLLKALERLVFLKNYKDKIGKNDYYLREQPEAWEAAKSLLAEHFVDMATFKIVQSEAKDEHPTSIEQSPCNFCGKLLREQMKGCNEPSCYRQHLKSKVEHINSIGGLPKLSEPLISEEDFKNWEKDNKIEHDPEPVRLPGENSIDFAARKNEWKSKTK
jgi:hypothetical protein